MSERVRINSMILNWIGLIGLLLIVAGSVAAGERQAIGLDDSELNSSERGDYEVERKSDQESERNSIASDHDEDDEEDPNKFSSLLHDDDHGIFAHRSLLSSENIKSPSKDEDLDESDLAALKTSDFVEKEWQLMFRAFDRMLDGASSSIMEKIGSQTNLLDEIISRLRPQCKRDINHIRQSIKQHKIWALRMVDSNGKLPSGLTYGKLSSPGDYEECLAVSVNELVYRNANDRSPERHKFRGKYCLLDFRLPLPERPNRLLSVHEPVLNFTNTELIKQFPAIQNYSSIASAFYEVGYLHAFCLPSTCQVEDVVKSVGLSLEGIHILVNNTIDCEQKFDEPLPWRKSQLISLAFFALLFSNALFASLLHRLLPETPARSPADSSQLAQSGGKLIREPTDEDKRTSSRPTLYNEFSSSLGRLIARNGASYTDCFSIQTNFGRLTKPDPRGLAFVHYTRIVAMGLTVITHTAAMGTLQAVTKPADGTNTEQMFRDFLPQMLANAFTTIQIFFFMAGFMLVISAYPSIKREHGHISFLEYAIKRAIRLMPGLVATIAVNFVWPLFVDGPMLTYFINRIVVPCETNWWRTLLFLSNFDHVDEMCIRHSYFSASDYQLHIVAFPLLLLLYKHPTISLAFATLLTAAGFVAQVIMVLTKTLLPFIMLDYVDKVAFFNIIHYFHHPSWNHMSAFFYGFIIGYLVVKQIRVNLSASNIKRLWQIIIPTGVLSLFAPYFWNHYKRPIYKWQMVLYVVIDRFALLTMCAWLSYASLVLARRPAPAKKPAMNLPDIVSLEREKKADKNDGDQSLKQQPGQQSAALPRIAITSENNEQQLRPISSSVDTIHRQRSTPNLLCQLGNEPASTGTTMTRPHSSTNLNQAAKTDCVDSNSNDRTKSGSTGGQIGNSTGNQTGAAGQQRNQAPVSNVNTLCLVLSRLTFQLYLFNMVVLWIDVNHSKYYWFLSYNFIIMKAFAVYVGTVIFSMVFFLTLESPSLTLYIKWVKSRAQARAAKLTKRQTQKEASEKSATKLAQPVRRPARDSSPASGKSSNLDGGLCLRIGTPEQAVGRTGDFSYIDLAAPGIDTGRRSMARSEQQTKM